MIVQGHTHICMDICLLSYMDFYIFFCCIFAYKTFIVTFDIFILNLKLKTKPVELACAHSHRTYIWFLFPILRFFEHTSHVFSGPARRRRTSSSAGGDERAHKKYKTFNHFHCVCFASVRLKTHKWVVVVVTQNTRKNISNFTLLYTQHTYIYINKISEV